MKAKKSLGQHFLTSSHIAQRIVRAGHVQRTDTVIEIGPGTGMLTEALLETGARVLAVEKDPRAIEVLKERFGQYIDRGRLTLVQGDALEFLARGSEIPRRYKVISNIPYYITGAIIRRLLESTVQPECIVLLVQKEVAHRIARDKKASILSLSVRAYGTPQYLETISARFFKPVPKVDSAILRIEDISKKLFKNVTEEAFFSVVKRAFSKKRKLLIGNLTGLMDRSMLEGLFKDLGIDPRIRAEDASVELWKLLAENMNNKKSHG